MSNRLAHTRAGKLNGKERARVELGRKEFVWSWDGKTAESAGNASIERILGILVSQSIRTTGQYPRQMKLWHWLMVSPREQYHLDLWCLLGSRVLPR